MNKKNIIQLTVVFVLPLILSYLLIGKNLKSQWSIIDDHEIIAHIGEDYRLSPGDWWSRLKSSEAFQPGVSQRYRPIYYALRFAEMVLWGKNATLWFLFRYFIFIIFQVSCFVILRKFTGSVVSTLFILYLLTFSFWKDTVIRLGPSESYTILGLPLFIYAFFELWKLKTSKRNWFLFLFSTIICVGSKENFVFLLLPISLLFFRLVSLKKISKFGIFSWLSSVSVVLSIFWAFFSASQKYGSDIYSQSADINGRLALVIGGIKLLFTNWVVWLLPVVFIVLVTFLIVARKIHIASLLNDISVFCIFWLSLILIWLSQYVFYFGIWPTGDRYDFPGVLVVPLLWLELLLFVRWFGSRLDNKFISVVASFLFVLFLIYQIHFTGYSKLVVAAQSNFNETVAFTGNLNSLIKGIKQSNNCQIVFISNSPYDFEPIISLNEFLVSNKIYNDYTVEPTYCDKDFSDDKFLAFLSKSICKWSAEGNFGKYTISFDKSKMDNCCLGYGSGDSSRCKSFTKI